jgi:cell division protein FtsN
MNILSAKMRHHSAGSTRRKAAQAPIVELDRWQLTGLIGLMLVLTSGAFLVGVKVGEKQAPQDIERPALSVGGPITISSQQRHMALADVWPPTQEIDRDLARPLTPQLPSDPTERARAQAHQQLLESRSAGLRNDIPPPAQVAGAEAPPMVLAGAGQQQGFTLQVSLFDSQGAANAVAGELLEAGHPVRLRQVQASDGRSLYRVEVGQFSTGEAATAFQRRFESVSGYSAVLVPF